MTHRSEAPLCAAPPEGKDTDKALLRRRFEAARGSLTPEARAAAEEAITASLYALPAWASAPLVCGYLPVRGEIQTLPIWERAAAEGKGYALPVTVTGAKEGKMVFRSLPRYAPHELIPARYGLSEPSEACPTLSLADFAGALILVPGLAFDDGGFRIGYGGGYYDRFLSALRAERVPVTTVGLVFEACRAATLPRESHDIPVDLILDERRITHTHGG